MEIGETFYPLDRDSWRNWLRRNHRKAKEIWVVFYRKESGKPSLPYGEAVEEAICFGWIDGVVKKYNEFGRAQRFTPRRPGSLMSELNKERARKMIKANKMTKAGLESAGDLGLAEVVVADDIALALQQDPETWRNFEAFPESYRRIRLAFVEGARSRPDIFKTRLDYLVKMTKQNKRFGTSV